MRAESAERRQACVERGKADVLPFGLSEVSCVCVSSICERVSAASFSILFPLLPPSSIRGLLRSSCLGAHMRKKMKYGRAETQIIKSRQAPILCAEMMDASSLNPPLLLPPVLALTPAYWFFSSEGVSAEMSKTAEAKRVTKFTRGREGFIPHTRTWINTQQKIKRRHKRRKLSLSCGDVLFLNSDLS